jgi:hypothetical protein
MRHDLYLLSELLCPPPQPGCPILARSVRKGGILQLSNPRDFDRPMPCQTPTAPTSVASHPNVEERDVRIGHPAFLFLPLRSLHDKHVTCLNHRPRIFRIALFRSAHHSSCLVPSQQSSLLLIKNNLKFEQTYYGTKFLTQPSLHVRNYRTTCQGDCLASGKLKGGTLNAKVALYCHESSLN